jgi:hypothetical protein
LILFGVALVVFGFLPKEAYSDVVTVLRSFFQMAAGFLGFTMFFTGVHRLWGELIARRIAAIGAGAVLLLLAGVFGQMLWKGEVASSVVGFSGLLVLAGVYVLWVRRGASIRLFLF